MEICLGHQYTDQWTDNVMVEEFSSISWIIYVVVFCVYECMYGGGFVGFPLDKAVEYANLRNPLLINDLNMQYYIQDRYNGEHTRSTSCSYFVKVC